MKSSPSNLDAKMVSASCAKNQSQSVHSVLRHLLTNLILSPPQLLVTLLSEVATGAIAGPRSHI